MSLCCSPEETPSIEIAEYFFPIERERRRHARWKHRHVDDDGALLQRCLHGVRRRGVRQRHRFAIRLEAVLRQAHLHRVTAARWELTDRGGRHVGPHVTVDPNRGARRVRRDLDRALRDRGLRRGRRLLRRELRLSLLHHVNGAADADDDGEQRDDRADRSHPASTRGRNVRERVRRSGCAQERRGHVERRVERLLLIDDVRELLALEQRFLLRLRACPRRAPA